MDNTTGYIYIYCFSNPSFENGTCKIGCTHYENWEQVTIKKKVTGNKHNSKEPYFSLQREGNFHYYPIKLHRQVGQPSPVVNTNNIKILRRGYWCG